MAVNQMLLNTVKDRKTAGTAGCGCSACTPTFTCTRKRHGWLAIFCAGETTCTSCQNSCHHIL